MTCMLTPERLAAFADGQLSEASARTVATHVGDCAECARALAALRSLRHAIRTHAATGDPPPGFEARVRAAVVGAQARTGARTRVLRRRQLGQAAAVVIGLTAAAWGGYRWGASAPPAGVPERLIEAHTRSLLTSHLTDVAASDRHVVKPWFAGKIDVSPPAPDLAAEGFPLVGGRIDYVGGRPVAVVVYGHGRHLINVFVWSAPTAGTSARVMERGGYHMVGWSDPGREVWAVSDLMRSELVRFTELLRRAD